MISVPSVVNELIFAINLGLLQLVRIVDVNRFPLRVEVDGANPALAVAVASRFGTAERQMHLGADGGGVDVSDARIQVANRGECLVDVLGVQRGRQAVLDPIGDFNGIFKIVARDD